MTQVEKQAEQKILDAARKVFRKSGLGGARMQHIADEAAINKASLHYYYRSKKKLFEAVFREDFQQFLIPLSEILFRDSQLTTEDRIRTFVKSFIQTLIENPNLPLFIMNELSGNPDRLFELVKRRILITHDDEIGDKDKPDPNTFIRQIREGIEVGRYHQVVPEQFVISLIGMCVYPFIARPILRYWLKKDDAQYNKFLLERQAEVIDYAFRILIRKYKPYQQKHN